MTDQRGPVLTKCPTRRALISLLLAGVTLCTIPAASANSDAPISAEAAAWNANRETWVFGDMRTEGARRAGEGLVDAVNYDTAPILAKIAGNPAAPEFFSQPAFKSAEWEAEIAYTLANHETARGALRSGFDMIDDLALSVHLHSKLAELPPVDDVAREWAKINSYGDLLIMCLSTEDGYREEKQAVGHSQGRRFVDFIVNYATPDRCATFVDGH